MTKCSSNSVNRMNEWLNPPCTWHDCEIDFPSAPGLYPVWTDYGRLEIASYIPRTQAWYLADGEEIIVHYWHEPLGTPF